MRITLRLALCAAALLFVAGAARAADGVLIVQTMTLNGKTQTNQVQIEHNRMRAEIADPVSGQKQAIIFDAAKQVLDIVNVERKTYTELTKAEMEQIGAQMQQMAAQMESMMANMPPAQRAQVEGMMRGRGMGRGAAPKPEYRKAGSDHAGKWTCDKYEGYLNGQKIMDVCTVEPGALGLTQAEVDVMRQLAEFFQAVAPQSSGMIEVGRPEDQGFSGVPVKTLSTAGGREVATEITDVARHTFPDSLFQVPEGFQKQAFLGRGRGQ